MYLNPGLESISRGTDNVRNVDPSNTTEGSNRYIRDERNLLAHFKQDLQYRSDFGYIQYNSGGILQGTVTVIPRTFVKGSNYHEPQTMKLRRKKTTISNYLWTMLRPMIEDLKNEKKRRLVPFQNELKL